MSQFPLKKEYHEKNIFYYMYILRDIFMYY